MSANYWKQPIKWNEAARKAGKRARVFCASMADVFEDHPQVEPWRRRLWETIQMTPWLHWLLLTKRPENMRAMLPPNWIERPLPNVWLGTSAEDQRRFDERIDALMSTPAAIHFLSCEPLLGPIDTRRYKPAWIIVGGESGPGARPMHPDWARELRDQCEVKGIRYFFKQWGEYRPATIDDPDRICGTIGIASDMAILARVGKHAAGRLLDGRTWDEFPV